MNNIFQTLISSVLLLGIAPGAFSQSQEESEKSTKGTSGETRMVTYLGVGTNQVSDALRQHVDITDGIGLIIEQVAPDSPAQEAGIEQYDILLEMDGQIIVNRDQLTTLVRSKKPGVTVDLKVVREGNQLTIPVKLEERNISQEPRVRRSFRFYRPMGGSEEDKKWALPFEMEDLEKYINEVQEKAAKVGNKALQYVPDIILERENEDGSHQITTYAQGHKRMKLSRNGYVATIEVIDDNKHFRIVGKKGEALYEGGEPGEEDLKNLPEEVRSMVQKLNNPESFNLKSLKDMSGSKVRVIFTKEEKGEEALGR